MRSLRSRLLAYLGLATLVATALTVGVAALLVARDLDAQALAGLERQADAAAATTPQGSMRAGRDQVFLRRAGRFRALPSRAPLAVRLREAVPPAGDASGRVELVRRDPAAGDRSLLYAARDTSTGRVILARGARLERGDWRPYAASLLLAGLGGLLVAGALSGVLARRLARPVGELSEASARLGAGDPSARVPVRGRDELAALAESFNRMAGELQTARGAQRDFLLSVSHELKTPLAAVRGYAEALADGAVGSDECARTITLEAGRLEALIGDLLSLARLERPDFAVACEPVDLGAVVRAAAERAESHARELGVSLDVEAGGSAWTLGDRERLLQVVSNLVDNALRVTTRGGRVAVTAAPGEIAVSDTGPGLDPGDLPRAFERFYLHDRYRSERPVGSGLGLAVVGELVRAMGGSAVAESHPGEGATFRVSLPVETTREPRVADSGALPRVY